MYEETLITNLSQGANHFGLRDNFSNILKSNSEYCNSTFVDEVLSEREYSQNLKHFDDVFETIEKIYNQASNILMHQKKLITIGGDHATSIGTIRSRANYSNDFGVLWIDAHADINTELSTQSGNIHGMPLSFLLGNTNVPTSMNYSCLKPNQIAYLGLRDVEEQEKNILCDKKIKNCSYSYMKDIGLDGALIEVSNYFKEQNISKLHISFDLDAVDYQYIKGVSVPVMNGGFTLDEMQKMLSFFTSNFLVSSCDIVEYNPYFDKSNSTLNFVELIADFMRSKLVNID